MSSLPPLADVFAFADRDPRIVADVRARLEAASAFDEVREPVAGWVVASKALPGKPPPQHDPSFVFAQGADLSPAVNERDLDRLAELPGDFAFLHLQPGGSATVVRACGAGPPFYLFANDGRRAVATRVADLLRYLPDQLNPDPLTLAIRARGYGANPDNRSFFTDVSVLPRGYAAAFGPRGGPSLRRYWDPRPDRLDPPDQLPQQAAELRRRLLGALDRDLDPEGGNLLTLSGGADSSALAGLIRGTLGFPLASLSFVVEHEPAWRAAFPTVARVVRHWNIEPAWVYPLSVATRLEFIAAAPAVGRPVGHPVLGALPAVTTRHDVRVVLGGESADEVCGSALTFADWVNETSALTLLRTPASQLPFGSRDRPRWLKKRAKRAIGQPELPYPIELPDFFTPPLREEYREWRNRRERQARTDNRPRRTFAMQMEQDGWLAMNWEVCSALGVRRSAPFMAREVLELAYRCHPRALIGPGTKRLLRAAVVGDVPASHLDRGKGGPPVPQETPPGWTMPDLGPLSEMVDHDVLARRRPTASDALALQILATTAAGMSLLRGDRASAPTGGTAG